MTIGTRLVLPGVSPVRAATDDSPGRVRHRAFHRRRLSEISPKIAFPQEPQRYIRRIEVIHARIQSLQIASHNVEFDLVESSGASSGAKVEFSTRSCSLFRNPCREI